MDLTQQKSEEQAIFIASIAGLVIQLDVPYCRQAAKDMLKQASFQESAAALNPSHPQEKNDIMRLQAKALNSLCDYVEALKEVAKIKGTLSRKSDFQNDIAKIFM